MLRKSGFCYKGIIGFVVIVLVGTFLCVDLLRSKQTLAFELGLPEPTELLSLTKSYNPIILRGMQIHLKDPFKFDFIIDEGDSNLNDAQLKEQTSKLIRYFLAAVTIPSEDLWVNLSPYENDRIIPEELSGTDLGHDMLAQDYVLKQLSSSLTHPDTLLGKLYWNAKQQDSFNKIWITPESAEIFEEDGKAMLGENSLKVMTEKDYLASQEAGVKNNNSKIDEDLIAEISTELNHGKHFSNLRQMYNALILAEWFKQKVRNSIYQQIYVDKKKINGIDYKDSEAKGKIYNLYCEAFKKGVYDIVKKEKGNHKSVKKRYFSGGVNGQNISNVVSSSIKPLKQFAFVRKNYGKFKDVQIQVFPKIKRGRDVISNKYLTGRLGSSSSSVVVEDEKNAWNQTKYIKKIRDSQGRLLAPNGKPSLLSEKYWKLVRTDTFKKWFGDWEKYPEQASKIVDENGEPLVVWHISDSKFTIFREDKIAVRTDRLQGGLGSGMYFANRQDILDNFSYDEKSVIYEVFLNLRNPKVVDQSDFRTNPVLGPLRKEFFELKKMLNSASVEEQVNVSKRMQEINKFLKKIADKDTADALKQGFDGALDMPQYKEVNGQSIAVPSNKSYAILVYKPESGAIKSIDNVGTFDASNSDILEWTNLNYSIDFKSIGSDVKEFETAIGNKAKTKDDVKRKASNNGVAVLDVENNQWGNNLMTVVPKDTIANDDIAVELMMQAVRVGDIVKDSLGAQRMNYEFIAGKDGYPEKIYVLPRFDGEPADLKKAPASWYLEKGKMYDGRTDRKLLEQVKTKLVFGVNDVVSEVNNQISKYLEKARNGEHNGLIARMSTGYLVLADLQNANKIEGWSILLSDPEYKSIDNTPVDVRRQFFKDMIIAGRSIIDSMQKKNAVSGMHYAINGNELNVLHAHFFPRNNTEPANLQLLPPYHHKLSVDDNVGDRLKELYGDFITHIANRIKEKQDASSALGGLDMKISKEFKLNQISSIEFDFSGLEVDGDRLSGFSFEIIEFKDIN